MPKSATATKPATKKPAKNLPPREIAYDHYYVSVYAEGSDDGPMTADMMKVLLGWEEETDDVKFDDDYLCKGRDDKTKVRCANNLGNRPFTDATAEKWMQEMLNGRWHLNGENLIVGKYGTILSAQHRGVGLVWAQQEIDLHPELWAKRWPEGLRVNMSVAYGVDEAHEVVNTIDTGAPRTLADVLYRSHHFAKLGPKERKTAAKALDSAVRLVWHRTGAENNAYAPRKTHAEFLDMIDRHPGLVKSVVHVLGEPADKVRTFLPPGIMSGILYLFGLRNANGDKYRSKWPYKEPRVEKADAEKSEEFLTFLLGDSPEFKGVWDCLSGMIEPSVREREALVVNAMNEFAAGGKLTAKNVEPEYEADPETGVLRLTRMPTLGGIDVGQPDDPVEAEAGETEVVVVEDGGDDNPDGDDPAEVEAAKTEARAKK